MMICGNKRIYSAAILLLIFAGAACASTPESEEEVAPTPPATIDAEAALDQARPWLAADTQIVISWGDHSQWQDSLEALLFVEHPTAEPGQLGTAMGLRQDLQALWNRHLGYDPGRSQAMVIGVNLEDETYVSLLFGDFELAPSLESTEVAGQTLYLQATNPMATDLFGEVSGGASDAPAKADDGGDKTDDESTAEADEPTSQTYLRLIDGPQPALIQSNNPQLLVGDADANADANADDSASLAALTPYLQDLPHSSFAMAINLASLADYFEAQEESAGDESELAEESADESNEESADDESELAEESADESTDEDEGMDWRRQDLPEVAVLTYGQSLGLVLGDEEEKLIALADRIADSAAELQADVTARYRESDAGDSFYDRLEATYSFHATEAIISQLEPRIDARRLEYQVLLPDVERPLWTVGIHGSLVGFIMARHLLGDITQDLENLPGDDPVDSVDIAAPPK